MLVRTLALKYGKNHIMTMSLEVEKIILSFVNILLTIRKNGHKTSFIRNKKGLIQMNQAFNFYLLLIDVKLLTATVVLINVVDVLVAAT